MFFLFLGIAALAIGIAQLAGGDHRKPPVITPIPPKPIPKPLPKTNPKRSAPLPAGVDVTPAKPLGVGRFQVQVQNKETSRLELVYDGDNAMKAWMVYNQMAADDRGVVMWDRQYSTSQPTRIFTPNAGEWKSN